MAETGSRQAADAALQVRDQVAAQAHKIGVARERSRRKYLVGCFGDRRLRGHVVIGGIEFRHQRFELGNHRGVVARDDQCGTFPNRIRSQVERHAGDYIRQARVLAAGHAHAIHAKRGICWRLYHVAIRAAAIQDFHGLQNVVCAAGMAGPNGAVRAAVVGGQNQAPVHNAGCHLVALGISAAADKGGNVCKRVGGCDGNGCALCNVGDGCGVASLAADGVAAAAEGEL